MNDQKSPSILGDTPAPFSGQPRITGVAPEFDQVFAEWTKNKTPATNTRLLNTVQPVVDTALSSYAEAASPALKSRARLLALQSMESYDPAKGNVRTHLLTNLQRLRRLNAQHQNIIKVPEQVGLDFQKIDTAQEDLRDQLSRDPSDEELADYTGLSVRRIRKVRSFNKPVATGMTDQETTDDIGGDIASSVPGRENDKTNAWLDFVYDDLTPTDKLIMDMTLGRHGRRRVSTQEIAKKLNISPGAVSQRAAKIQAMLDARFRHNF